MSGVKPRYDGGGDGWSNQHRILLGRDFHMQHVDCLFGFIAFGENTGDKLFLEYVPDNYENRGKSIRHFGVVSMFDRKRSEEFAFSERNSLSLAFYLHACRTFKVVQGQGPKFFFVIGDNEPSWKMIEVDITTGERKGDVTLNNLNWEHIWESLGLTRLREELKALVGAART